MELFLFFVYHPHHPHSHLFVSFGAQKVIFLLTRELGCLFTEPEKTTVLRVGAVRTFKCECIARWLPFTELHFFEWCLLVYACAR